MMRATPCCAIRKPAAEWPESNALLTPKGLHKYRNPRQLNSEHFSASTDEGNNVAMPYKTIFELSHSSVTVGQMRRGEEVDSLRVILVSQDGTEKELVGDRRKLAIYRLLDVINHNESLKKGQDARPRKFSQSDMDEIIRDTLKRTPAN